MMRSHTMSSITTEKSPYCQITRDPVTGAYGFICTEHGVLRTGLAQQHAVNVETKHLREHHAPPMEAILQNLTLDLTAAAVRVGAAYMIGEVAGPDYHPPILDAWEAMTGLGRDDARDLAVHIVGHHDQVTAAVVPV
jgi:hypothetical protein